MSMLKEFIHKEHPRKKLKSIESGKCPILPDFAHIVITTGKNPWDGKSHR